MVDITNETSDLTHTPVHNLCACGAAAQQCQPAALVRSLPRPVRRKKTNKFPPLIKGETVSSCLQAGDARARVDLLPAGVRVVIKDINPTGSSVETFAAVLLAATWSKRCLVLTLVYM